LDTKVILFSYDPCVERVCAAAMRSCYSPHSGYDLFKGIELEGEKILDDQQVKSMLRKAIGLGHHDVLEHGHFTYDIQGISRACSHQLVRHRIASYSQQSQRYVKPTRTYGYIKPPSIERVGKIAVKVGGVEYRFAFEDIIDITRQMEEKLVKMGIKPEDSRYLRPNAAATNIVVSMNPRQLLHVFALRCASPAQWEIRDIAWAMYICAKLIAPTIFETIPNTQSDDYVESRIGKADEIINRVREGFKEAPYESLLEIPLEDLNLEHTVHAYVKIK